MKRNSLCIVALLAAVLLGLTALWSGPREEAAEVSFPPDLPPPPQGPEPERSGPRDLDQAVAPREAQPGDAIRLAFDLAQDFEVEMGAGSFLDLGPDSSGGTTARGSSRFKGRAEVSEHEKGGDEGGILCLVLREASFEARTEEEGGALPVEGVAAMMKEPYLVRLAGDGRFESFLLPPDLPAQLVQVVLGLLFELQIVTPPRTPESWVSTEECDLGRAVFEYRRSGRSLEKVCREIDELAMAGEPLAAADLSVAVEGGRRIVLDQRGRTLRVEGRERLCLASAELGLTVVFDRRTSIVAEGGAPLPSAAEIERLVDERQAIPAGDRMFRERLAGEARAASELARIDGLTVEDALDHLMSALEGDIEGTGDTGQALHELGLLLRHDLEALRAVESLLDGPSPPLGDSLLAALGEAGTPEAQAVLARVFASGEAGESIRIAALQSFVQVESPTAATAGAIRRLIESGEDGDVGLTAFLVAGGVAGRLESDAEGRRLLDAVRAEAGRRGGEWEVAYVAALGNAGHPSIEGAILPYLAAEDPRVRATAVRSLRELSSSGARAAVRNALEEDGSPEVRLEALRVLAGRGDEESVRAIRWAVDADPEESVREEARRILDRDGY
ncbi:MAG: HEAT repeat domain-containing protein [Planctomycetes bacterium]|nr:HEAT repeat domain-containing protein [Planctomycetota bacterium]